MDAKRPALWTPGDWNAFSAAAVGADKLGQVGVLYHGMAVMGGGSILAGLILGAIAACVIDRKFLKAGGFAVAGSILTFFGFMHDELIGFARTPVVALAYLGVAGTLFACARYAVPAMVPAAAESGEHVAAIGEPAEAGA
jgi:AGZA family xanthine/uracil permease-like MFS transporter